MCSVLTTLEAAAIVCGTSGAQAAGFTLTSPTIKPVAKLTDALVGFVINASCLASVSFTARDGRQ